MSTACCIITRSDVEPDRNLMALRKEVISVALLGLVRSGYKRDVVGLIDCKQFCSRAPAEPDGTR